MAVPDSFALFSLASPLLPGADIDLNLFEPRYFNLIRERSGLDPFVAVVMIVSGSEVGVQPLILTIGTAASLAVSVCHPDGRFAIPLHGTRRFRVLTQDWSSEYLVGKLQWIADSPDADVELIHELADRFVAYVQAIARFTRSDPNDAKIERSVRGIPAAKAVDRAFQIASMIPVDLWQKQAPIETLDEAALVRSVARLTDMHASRAALHGPAAPIGSHAGRRFTPN